MSMLPAAGSFQPLKKVKYKDIGVGSKVEIEDVQGGVETFLGTVVEFRPEFGPSSLPTLIILPDGAQNTVIVTESGKWRVTVRVPAIKSTEFNPPSHLAHIRRRPTAQTAIRFSGGIHSAIEIVQWLAGTVTVVYEEAVPGERPEALVMPRLEGEDRAVNGDWVVLSADGSRATVVKPDVFADEFDVVQAPAREGVTAAELAGGDDGDLQPTAFPPPAAFQAPLPPVGMPGFLQS